MYPIRFKTGLAAAAYVDPDCVTAVLGGDYATQIVVDGTTITVQESVEDVVRKLGWEAAPEREQQ